MLYELVAGRPPFVAPSPMAVVSAHLSQEPPPLAKLAPGVSRAFAEVVHRALEKRPEDWFPSADAMREALVGTSARAGRRGRSAGGERDAGGGLASRADFDALGALRPGRVVPLALAAVVLLGAAAVAWRWQDVSGFLAARVPALVAALPAALRPAPPLDGAALGTAQGIASPPSPEGEPAAPAASPPPVPVEEPPPDVEPSDEEQARAAALGTEVDAGAADEPSQEAGGGGQESGAPRPLPAEPEAFGPGAPPPPGGAVSEVVDGQGRLRLSFEPRLEAMVPLVEPAAAP